MLEPAEKTEFQKLLSKPALIIPLVIVLLLVLFGAIVVVVKNAGRVQVGPAPIVLGPIPTDTTMARPRNQLQKGIERLEKRLTQYYQKLNSPTPAQDSLYRICQEGIARLWKEFSAVEAANSYQERKELFSRTRKNYVSLRDLVTDFVRSVDSTVSRASLDSLDIEFKRLISE
jgi:hypothetical protein|uniref:Uncharacterized protein n=1 Tax=candidate division WOR-3 bacterium TaxID=2052148 RepID=A0A7V3PSE5_UNCW3